eukprot:2164944-Rhodomonas_salina.2
MPCTVLTSDVGTVERICFGMSGTDTGYATTAVGTVVPERSWLMGGAALDDVQLDQVCAYLRNAYP